MKLRYLLSDIGYPTDDTVTDTELTDIVYDSRKAVYGTAFVCLRGARADGHAFAESAYEKGCRVFFAEHTLPLPPDAQVILFADTRMALAQLSDAFFRHPQRELCIIGVTGTKGKTTVVNLLSAVLNANGYPTGTIGTIGITYNGKTYPTVNSTPESYILHKTFRQMADAGIRYVAMEVSSQALFTHRADTIAFDTAVFTNLSEDHIGEGEHPSFAHYMQSKMRLFSMCGFAVLNADSPYYPDFANACRAPYVSFGYKENADYRISSPAPWKEETAMGIDFMMSDKERDCPFSLRIPGSFNAENAAAVIAVLHHLGLSYEQIQKPLSAATVAGRFEILDVLPFCTVILDYAHNEISMRNLLETVRAYHPKRIVCIYGSVGGRTRHRRRELALVSGDLADFCIVTTDNPDFESPEAIVHEIGSYYTEDMCPHKEIVDRAEAIRYALQMAQPGDILLFCGKGHETYQIINGVHVPFSEKEILMRYHDTYCTENSRVLQPT